MPEVPSQVQAVTSVNDSGYPETQRANIEAREAQLVACPGCGCKVIRLHGIDSEGFFQYAKCSKCSFRASPDDWQKRVSGQLELGL